MQKVLTSNYLVGGNAVCVGCYQRENIELYFIMPMDNIVHPCTLRNIKYTFILWSYMASYIKFIYCMLLFRRAVFLIDALTIILYQSKLNLIKVILATMTGFNIWALAMYVHACHRVTDFAKLYAHYVHSMNL